MRGADFVKGGRAEKEKKMNANYRSIVLAVCLLFALSASTSAAPGDLDPTFGNGGIVISRGSNPNHLDTAWGMAIQPDGKIVVVGGGTVGENWDFAVVRYNPDGSLDSSFGGTGIVITQLDPINYESAQSVAIQADGKIVVGGAGWIVRYNPNGSLDTTFNGTGIVTPGSGVLSVAVQSDGKIVATGGDGLASGVALVRYNADGSLDTTFNGTGKVITPGGAANSVAIQSDGRIIAAGSNHFGPNADFMLVRHNADGTPDTSFNGTGKVITPVGNSGGGANDLAIQTDGKIVVVGNSYDSSVSSRLAVVRYNPDGSLDTSFGGTGKILIPASEVSDNASSVAIQPNGKIVVAGSSGRFNIGSDFAVVRLNPNGSPDTSFNGTGKIITSVDNDFEYASSVAIQADGKIVVAGDAGDNSNVNTDFVVLRYQGDDATPAACPNPIDCAAFFVRQHYRDFLGREPDAAGLAFWTGEITFCGSDAGCVEVKRINVSAAFFLSIEFQESGYLVYRTRRAAFGTLPGKPVPVVRDTFLPEARSLAADVILGTDGWQGRLESNKNAYMLGFVRRTDFLSLYPRGMTPAEFVDALNAQAGGVLDTAERGALVGELQADNTDAGRALVLRRVAEDSTLRQREFNGAFVFMQYAGYLSRDPDAAPDANYSGYQFWLSKLDQFNGNYVEAEMVKAFLSSDEYRRRFGQP
jgi:uncharacterized delta-60 repeat protein